MWQDARSLAWRFQRRIRAIESAFALDGQLHPFAGTKPAHFARAASEFGKT